MFDCFFADAYFENVTKISSQFLKRNGIYGLILDVDNTLVGHNVPIPEEYILNHLRTLETDGIKLCVVSNNTKSRVKKFCKKIGIDYYVANALKPRLKGYKSAAREMNLPLSSIGAVGDQVFTDVWGAKKAGCFAILTKPLYKGGEGAFIAFKRMLEKPFLPDNFE